MKARVLVMTVGLCAVAMAKSRNYYFIPSLGGGTAVTNRVGGLALVGWVVQPIANDDDVGYPPTTNGPHYIDVLNGEEYFANQSITNLMGYDNCAGNGLIGDGEGSWATAKYGDGYGYIRFFSDWTITGAAYYADSSRNSLTSSGSPNIYDDVIVISNVNPAYVIPGFGVVVPGKWELVDGVPYVGVSGQVGTTPVGGANQLADYMVSVRWENVTLGTGGYVAVGNGGWAVSAVPLATAYPDQVTNTLRFIAVGISARPGLPVSQEEIRYVITVPEPASVVGVMTVIIAILQAQRTRRHV